MRTNHFLPILTLLIISMLYSCSKDDEKTLSDLMENEFLLQPAHPVSNDEVFFILHDCNYNEFAYFTKEGFDIDVVKHFNGMMKRPCVLNYDTISLGNLEPGTYNITFLLIDISTFAIADSISYSHTQTLVVGK